MTNTTKTITFNGLTRVADIEELTQSIMNGETSVLMGDAIITTIAVSDNAYLLYYNACPDALMHVATLLFAGVLLNGVIYARGGANCFNDYRPQSLEVAMAKTKSDITKIIYDLYNVIEVKPSDFADYELPLAKITAKQLLTGVIESDNKIEPRLSDDDILPVFLGVISANEMAAAHVNDNAAFYAWRKAKDKKARELIEQHKAGNETWYNVFDAVTEASSETLTIEVKLNNRSVTSKITKSTLLKLLSEGDDAVIEQSHFLGSCGLSVMRELYGNTYDNKHSVLTLSNIVRVSA